MGEPSSSTTTTNVISVADQVDDSYFSVLFCTSNHEDEEVYDLEEEDQMQFPISDDKYAAELQLQEVLLASSATAHVPSSRTEPSPSGSCGSGATSSASAFFCSICMEAAPEEEVFKKSSCSHAFCRHCLGRYIATKVQENVHMVRCPEVDCSGVLEPELCQDILPPEVFDRWGSALCKSILLAAKKTVYCPFKDCSAMMVDDNDDAGEAAARVTQAECPLCWRLFCAQCMVAWHAGVECEEYRRLGDDEKGREDLLLMEVAKSKGWKRCPRCNFFVDKTDGCLHITCRCGFEFCYRCGLQWRRNHTCKLRCLKLSTTLS